MQRAIIGLSRVFAIISALSVVVLMLSITADVVVRTITQASLPGMIELAESCLVVAVFFGLALAGVRGEHVAVTLLADRLSATWNKAFNLVVWIVSTIFLAWMLFATIERAIDATEQGEERFGLVQWPLWPLRWIIVVGFAALLLVAIVNMVRTITRRDPLGAGSELALALEQEQAAETDSAAGATSPDDSAVAARADESSGARDADTTSRKDDA